jgi:hypothetical protein
MFIAGYSWGQVNRSSSGSSSSDAAIPACVVDVRWVNTNGTITYSKQLQTPVSASLLVHISKGSACSNAEVRITATFLTEGQEFICSGTIPQAMTMASQSQIFNLEIRPLTQQDFVRWRNQPGAFGLRQGKSLMCANLDGTSDVSDIDRSKAKWIHIAVAVLPAGGGLAVLGGVIHITD